MADRDRQDGVYRVLAPGRVNLLGEHIDYNDGPVLPAAIDRRVTLTARAGEDRIARIEAADLEQTCTFDLDEVEKRVDTSGRPLPKWALYPAGVAWALQKNGLPVTGMSGRFRSDIPIGSGLSSSAAVEVAFAALWQALGGWDVTRLRLAQLCQQAEVSYVGVNSGLMDQFASACGVARHALYFDTRSLESEAVRLPAGTAIVIADSTRRRSLTNSAYNERRAECEEAVRLLKTRLPEIRSLRDVTPGELRQNAGLLPERIRKRAEHVVSEIARVEEAVERLKAGEVAAFGRLMLEGHASLRDLYEVSIPELDRLVEIAAGLEGCWGARLSGAGFGGCTVNLVQAEAAEGFTAALRREYQRATGINAPVYLCAASDGAVVSRE